MVGRYSPQMLEQICGLKFPSTGSRTFQLSSLAIWITNATSSSKWRGTVTMLAPRASVHPQFTSARMTTAIRGWFRIVFVHLPHKNSWKSKSRTLYAARSHSASLSSPRTPLSVILATVRALFSFLRAFRCARAIYRTISQKFWWLRMCTKSTDMICASSMGLGKCFLSLAWSWVTTVRTIVM